MPLGIVEQVGAMDFVGGHLAQFGAPEAHEIAIQVVVARLGEDVEIAVFTGVAAHAGDIIPVAPIAARVVVK